MASVWLMAGSLLGGLHALWLWHGVHRASVFVAASALLRLLAVAVGLVAAAVCGGLLPATAGWAAGFAAAAGFCLLRRRAK